MGRGMNTYIVKFRTRDHRDGIAYVIESSEEKAIAYVKEHYQGK